MSAYKAFLSSLDGSYNFPMMPKLTTIGRENCDIVILNNTMDQQHAVIEYDDEEGRYSIHDLNSVSGTFVNNCRVNTNAFVALNEGDVVKFGSNGIGYRFCYQQQKASVPQQVITQIPPIGLHRQSYTSNQLNQNQQSQLYVANQSGHNCSVHAQSINGFWLSPEQLPNGQFITIQNQPPGTTIISPVKPKSNPSSLRRPLSSQSHRNQSREQINVSYNMKAQAAFPQGALCVGSSQGRDMTRNVNTETYRQGERSTELLEIERDELKAKVESFEKEMKKKDLEIKDLKEKAGEMKLLKEKTKDYDQVKRDKSIATGLVNTYQKDLANKEAANSKLLREIDSLKSQLTCNAELMEKDQELYNLKAKTKLREDQIIEITAQVMKLTEQIELNSARAEARTTEFKELEDQLRQDLEVSRKQFVDMQEAEKTLRTDLDVLQQHFDKFRVAIVQAVQSMPDRQVGEEMSDDGLVEELKAITEICTTRAQIVEDLNGHLGSSVQAQSDLLEAIKQFAGKITEIGANLQTNGIGSLEAQLTAVKEESCVESLQVVRDALATEIENMLTWSRGLEAAKSAAEAQLAESVEAKNGLVSEMEVKVGEFTAKVAELEGSLADSQNKSVELAGQLSVMEVQSKLLVEEHSKQMEELKRVHETQLAELKANVEDLNSQLEVESQELNNLKSELCGERGGQLELKERALEAECKLKLAEEVYSQKLADLKLANRNAENSYSIELTIHKEQIKQHALTIVSFEKDIIRYKQQELNLLDRIRELETCQPVLVNQPPVQSRNQEELRQSMDTVSHECKKYKQRLAEQDELVKTLRRDLAGASAKLSDTHGEMSEKQKRELERNKSLVIEQQKELGVTRAQLAKLSEIVEKQTEQLEQVSPELTKANALVDKYRQTSEENGHLCIELKAKLERVECEFKQFDLVKCEEGKISSELAAAGAQCRGERHEQVITRQREALNELRQKIKTLEQSRPSTSNQQQLQQQVMLLKKQLAEVRASQALNEDIVKHVNLSRGQDDSNFIIEEKTAHYETQTALEASEESYLTLVKTICCLLDISELDGLRSMVSLPCDERIKLNQARAKSVEAICLKIKELIEKSERKEELLKDYEMDLAKLRQAEFLLAKKSEQLDESHLNTRNREDEIECLKQSLLNTKSDLDKERLLNSALKQKKTLNAVPNSLPPTSARRFSSDKLHHHCPPDNSHNQAQITKAMNEKIKRKDYELKTLKQEIKEKTSELTKLAESKHSHHNHHHHNHTALNL